MFRRLSRFLGLASVLGFALPNAEADAADAPGVTLELLAETSAIQPGEPFQVGLRIRHASGWHTYWRHPGIVGVPTRLQWDLPPGFRAGPIQWPYPERVRMAIYTAYGFERDVLLPVTITPPPRLKPGNTVTLRASAHWMACAATCHPGNREFVLQLPVDPNATGKSGEHRQLFARSRADRPSPLSGWTGIPGRSEDRLTLTLRPSQPGSRLPPGKRYFFSYDGQVHSDHPQTVERLPDGALRFTLVPGPFPPGDPPALSGVVYSETGWPQAPDRTYVEVRAPWENGN